MTRSGADRLRVAVVGAGPGGSLLARDLARGGVRVTVFDASHPRDKPCGGGITAKAVRLLPEAPASDPLPARRIDVCRFESGDGVAVDVPLASPVLVASRRELDAWLLRRAVEAGAVHRRERVLEVDAVGRVRTGRGADAFDVIVGADGAGSLVRRTLLAATPPSRLMMATGWLAPGDAAMLVRFLPGLAGYLWVFPRTDHVDVGICAPLASTPTPALLARLQREAARAFPQLVPESPRIYAQTIPSPSADAATIREIAGERWALVGDAAALADPLTGEGIHSALRSGQLLARTLLEHGSARDYPRRVLADFGHELLRAARLRERFYAPGFTHRMIRFAARSPAVRDVLGELVLGAQGYRGLRRRLLRAAPAFLVESGRSLLLQRSLR